MAGASPYIGLRHYEAGDRHRFYGRGQEARQVQALWMSNRMLVLYGRSGVGKTSLLRAGVIPLIGADDADLLPVSRVSQGSAFPAAVVPHHNPYTFALLSAWSQATSPAALAGMTISAFLLGLPETIDRYDTTLPLLAAIDQFEELFSDLPHRRSYRDEFVRELAAAVEELPRLRLLISIRDDFVARLFPYESDLAPPQGRARFAVQPLRRDAALEAVTRPLEPVGRRFDRGVAERLVDDLRTTTVTSSLGEVRESVAETVEPVHLQVVCSALWEALPEDVPVISLGHLRDHGNIDRALTDFCRRTVAEVAAQHGVPEPDVWDWLIRVFITDLGNRGTVYEGISTTGGMPNAVARALAERHVLRTEERAGSWWYELLHDRLIDPVRRGGRPSSVQTAPNPSPAVYLRTAEGALADGDLALAEKYAGDAVAFGGDHADPRTHAEAEAFLGTIAAKRGQLAEAETRFRNATTYFDALGDKTAVGQLQAALGRLLLDEAGRPGDAVVELQSASTRLPGDVDLRVDLARAYWALGEHQAATGLLGTALTILPAHVDALVLRGLITARTGSPAAALEDLANAIRLRPAIAERPEVGAAQEHARSRLNRR
ncbi:tetratricopeptide repeat protein [Parafrankia sp. FMc2]|uniref:nSTAND1 domain-containing NTPase n=1 Tax=Parafrankia sp. FMc2 TaxID=3233196 RepID=UPI0034D70252